MYVSFPASNSAKDEYVPLVVDLSEGAVRAMVFFIAALASPLVVSGRIADGDILRKIN